MSLNDYGKFYMYGSRMIIYGRIINIEAYWDEAKEIGGFDDLPEVFRNKNSIRIYFPGENILIENENDNRNVQDFMRCYIKYLNETVENVIINSELLVKLIRNADEG